jgi:hypothetical protein
MMVPPLPRVGLCCLLCLASLTTGCGSERKPVFPVRGKLTYRGQPMARAQVTYVLLKDGGLSRSASYATADANGEYRMSTYLQYDGVPPGDYVVTIRWPGARRGGNGDDDEKVGPDQLRDAYGYAATSKLRATVHEQDNEIDFRLP